MMDDNNRVTRNVLQGKPSANSRTGKVETINLIAEVTTLMKTAKNNIFKTKPTTLFTKAETYLAKSRTELDRGNYETAFHLAKEAYAQLQIAESDNTAATASEKEVAFAIPLHMRVIKNSNFRSSPSLNARILQVLRLGTDVKAVSYQGLWVKVIDTSEKQGWIHYSLLHRSCD